MSGTARPPGERWLDREGTPIPVGAMVEQTGVDLQLGALRSRLGKQGQVLRRTNAGLAAARARGRTGGRRPKMTPGKLATARQLYDGKAHTVAQIAEIVGVSRATLYRHLEPSEQRPASM